MRRALFFFLMFLFFSPCFAPALPPSGGTGLEADLVNKSVSTHDYFVHNRPKISMVLENQGNGTAAIKDVVLEIDKNYVVEHTTATILPGRIGVFSFRISRMDCSDMDSTYDYNISIKYDINSTDQDFVNYSGSFQVADPLSINTTPQTISIPVGQVLEYGIIVKNNGTKKIEYNISMEPGFYLQVLRKGEIYNVEDLDDQDFEASYSDPITLKFFGTETMQKSFDFEITHVSCPQISTQKGFFVKTYTSTGGIVDVDVSPDIGFFSLFLLGFLGILTIAKIYKTD